MKSTFCENVLFDLMKMVTLICKTLPCLFTKSAIFNLFILSFSRLRSRACLLIRHFSISISDFREFPASLDNALFDFTKTFTLLCKTLPTWLLNTSKRTRSCDNHKGQPRKTDQGSRIRDRWKILLSRTRKTPLSIASTRWPDEAGNEKRCFLDC